MAGVVALLAREPFVGEAWRVSGASVTSPSCLWCEGSVCVGVGCVEQIQTTDAVALLVREPFVGEAWRVSGASVTSPSCLWCEGSVCVGVGCVEQIQMAGVVALLVREPSVGEAWRVSGATTPTARTFPRCCRIAPLEWLKRALAPLQPAVWDFCGRGGAGGGFAGGGTHSCIPV